MKQIIFLIFILVVFLKGMYAQELIWKHTGGPKGGIVGDMAINSKGEIYAGVYPSWNVYTGLYKSTDNGESWFKVETQFEDFEVYAIYITKEDHIWVGTNFQDRIYLSTDNGATWENKKTGYNTNECWAFGESKDGIMFAGDGQYIQLYRSPDYGENWELSANLRPLVFATASNNIVYTGTHDGLFTTTDNGLTWAQNNFLANIPVSSILIDSNDNIYCGTGYYANGNGVFYSTDGGQNWTQLGLSGKVVLSLSFDSQGNIYAGTKQDGLFKTIDMGQTWQQYNNGLYRKDVFRLKLNKQDHIFVGSENEGVFRSTNYGESFEHIGLPISKVNNIVFSGDSLVFSATPSGVQVYQTHNKEWKNLGLHNVEAITIASSNHLYVATFDEGLYKSTDLGKSWSLTNLTKDSLMSVYNVLAINNDTIFAATEFNLRMSTNGGLNWSATPIKTTFFSRVLYLDHNSNLWVSGFGVNNYILYRSSNQGITFDSVYYGFYWLYQNSLSVTRNNFAYVSDLPPEIGITRSSNYGLTWNNVLPKQISKSVFGNHQGLVIAGSDSIFTSIDFGNTWNYQKYLGYENFTTEIEYYNGKYYLGTDRTGLYVVDVITSVDDKEKNLPKSYQLFQNFPNPFNPLTKIKFKVPKSEFVQIKVYDILGKEIKTLLNEYKTIGSYEVEFDARNLPSGVYFYRMISGSYTETKKMILLR